MSQFAILALGKIKGSELEPLCTMYQKRILWPLSIHELVCKKNIKGPGLKTEEAFLLKAHIQEKDFVIALDERGKNITSDALSEKIAQCQMTRMGRIVFIIGGADGLASEIINRANLKLSFGALTWPHMMVRAMLLEQIYRCQQILAGHPYHRA